MGEGRWEEFAVILRSRAAERQSRRLEAGSSGPGALGSKGNGKAACGTAELVGLLRRSGASRAAVQGLAGSLKGSPSDPKGEPRRGPQGDTGWGTGVKGA